MTTIIKKILVSNIGGLHCGKCTLSPGERYGLSMNIFLILSACYPNSLVIDTGVIFLKI